MTKTKGILTKKKLLQHKRTSPEKIMDWTECLQVHSIQMLFSSKNFQKENSVEQF